jgi:hypothetical protein
VLTASRENPLLARQFIRESVVHPIRQSLENVLQLIRNLSTVDPSFVLSPQRFQIIAAS